MSDGPLLMVLQQHGIPTRPVDVTEGLVEALYVAVEIGHAMRPGMGLMGTTIIGSTKCAVRPLPRHATQVGHLSSCRRQSTTDGAEWHEGPVGRTRLHGTVSGGR